MIQKSLLLVKFLKEVRPFGCWRDKKAVFAIFYFLNYFPIMQISIDILGILTNKIAKSKSPLFSLLQSSFFNKIRSAIRRLNELSTSNYQLSTIN